MGSHIVYNSLLKLQKQKHKNNQHIFFYVLFTVHLSISLDNDQLDAHLLYFTIRPLHSSACFKH